MISRATALTVSLLAVAFMASASPAVGQGNPNMPAVRAHVNKGNYLLSRRQFNEAISEYEEALKLDPTNPVAKSNIAEVHNNWAIMHYSQKHYGDALEEWEKALALQPNHANARRNMALMKQMMAAQGLSFDAEPDSTPDKNPATEKKPLKPETPKASAPPPAGSLVPKSAPEPESGPVMILTPGLRQPTTFAIGGDPDPEPPPPAARPAPAAQPTSIFGESSLPPVKKPAPVEAFPTASPQPTKISPLFPVMPELFPAQPRTASSPAPQPATSPPPATPAVSTYNDTATAVPVSAPAQHAAPAAGSLEEQLASVEMKVYGNRQTDLTVMQRLEKMERDTAGAVRSGTITDRINYLKQNFGL